MRIAMISEHASPLATVGGVDAGGQNLHVAGLATALARQNHEVTVYTRRDAIGLPERVRTAGGVEVVHVPVGPARAVPKDELLPYMRRFGHWVRRDWVRHGSPDTLHAHFWMSGVAALEATVASPVPVVLTYHALGSVKRRFQGSADTSPPVRVTVERQLGTAVDRVVAQSGDEVAELSRMGVGAPVVVIPSGVDLELFSPTGSSAPRRSGHRRVLSVGRLVPRKGFDALVRAVAAVPEAELVIAGGPPRGPDAVPEGARLRALAAELGVADRVRLLGAVGREDMPAWYRSADVVACTPWYEPFGLTPLEAMACGVPVVTYAVGGLAESVIDDGTGVHVAPGDIGRLAAELRALLADPARRESYGRAAVARARTRYAWDGTAAELSAVYAEVAAGRMLTRAAS
jgi:D-inositol-3-phosphate glycosyltransferase